MTATGHALLGTIIAAKISHPLLAIPLALLSHLLADLIPHWDVATNKRGKTVERLFAEAFIDVTLGFILSFLLLAFLFPQTDRFYALFIILVAQSPDWATAPYHFFNMRFPPFSWFYTFSKRFNIDLDKPWGVVTQAAVVLVLLLLALWW